MIPGLLVMITSQIRNVFRGKRHDYRTYCILSQYSRFPYERSHLRVHKRTKNGHRCST